MKWILGVSVFALPTLAYASTGGDASVTSIVLSAVSLAVQTVVATRIAPLEKRVAVLERRMSDHDEGVIR